MNDIRSIREALGLTQAEMAARLGVRQSAISRFETGERPVSKRTLLAAQALMMMAGKATKPKLRIAPKTDPSARKASIMDAYHDGLITAQDAEEWIVVEGLEES